MVSKKDSLKERAKALENAFFQKKEKELVMLINEQKKHSDEVSTLAQLSGIRNPTLLDIAVDLGLNQETFLALHLIPLVKVAWSDQVLDTKENKALHEICEEIHIEKDSLALKLFESWLEKDINPNLLIIWSDYVHELKRLLSIDQFREFEKETIHRCEVVAKASGGFLGINSISKKEQEMIIKIKNIMSGNKV